MSKPRHLMEYIGYLLVLLVLVGFLLVGYFLPTAEALALDDSLRLFGLSTMTKAQALTAEALALDDSLRLLALLGMSLVGIGRWVLRPPSAH